MVAPPRLRAVDLPELSPGDAYDLRPGETCDSLEFAGFDLTGVDLTATTLTDCRFAGASGAETSWRRAHVTMCAIEDAVLATLDAGANDWRAVSITGSRIGALDLHEAKISSIRFTRCRLGYVNLRHAEVSDVLFEECRIDELDCLGARLDRLTIASCEVGHLNVQDATLTDVDLTGADLRGLTGVTSLRGAAVSESQLLDLAPLLARALGLEVLPDTTA